MSDDAALPAASRILRSARALVARGGTAEISMGEVAAVAGVSKALVHYHFQDKDSLLQALANDVGAAVTTRARAALRRDATVADSHILDAYWLWLHQELLGGDIRVLLSLADYDSEAVRGVVQRVAIERGLIAGEQVAAIFTALGLQPRLPSALIGDAVIAFTDGLAVRHALDPSKDLRPAFDVLWLALLTLSE